MIFYGKRILFLGAHPDDIELGCGALIHHIARLSSVLCVTLSDNQKNPELKNVVDEHYKSMAVLGVSKEIRHLRVIRHPSVSARASGNSGIFLKLRSDFQPDIIFVTQFTGMFTKTITQCPKSPFGHSEESQFWASTSSGPRTGSSQISWLK